MKTLFHRLLLLCLMAVTVTSVTEVSGKRIKNSFSIPKESKNRSKVGQKIEGVQINLEDTLNMDGDTRISRMLGKCVFTGYDKEANSGMESFILKNESDKVLTGFLVRIDYLDMTGRMLHSRTVKEPCFIPSGETRRLDIKSWDTQHTFYYYLGNEPKRVATPYQVKFHPVAFWIEE